jgi:hypothetical protein
MLEINVQHHCNSLQQPKPQVRNRWVRPVRQLPGLIHVLDLLWRLPLRSSHPTPRTPTPTSLPETRGASTKEVNFGRGGGGGSGCGGWGSGCRGEGGMEVLGMVEEPWAGTGLECFVCRRAWKNNPTWFPPSPSVSVTLRTLPLCLCLPPYLPLSLLLSLCATE